MQTKFPMTPEGVRLLTEELKQLKTVERPRIIEAIATARAHGDLKENAEYHAAREQQSFMEGRIQDLEAKLSHVQVIDVSKMQSSGRVVFGVTVELLNTESEAVTRYRIVGEDEADIKQHKISYSSPLARALMGKQMDDVVLVQTPGGAVEYEIIAVFYA